LKLPPLPPSSPPTLLDTTTTRIENELFDHGLSATLAHYRNKWLARGKKHAWQVFGRALPLLYPSGAMPSAPPVEPCGADSVALKLARVEVGEEVVPLRGNEAWTSRDDVWWKVIEVEVEQDPEAEDEALYRKASVLSPVWGWLEGIGHEQMLGVESVWSESTLADDEEDQEIGREEWEDKFLGDERRGMDVTCPFCLREMGGMSIEVSPAF
jgi:hypothetical protein